MCVVWCVCVCVCVCVDNNKIIKIKINVVVCVCAGRVRRRETRTARGIHNEKRQKCYFVCLEGGRGGLHSLGD
jgi:hypothetical protein